MRNYSGFKRRVYSRDEREITSADIYRASYCAQMALMLTKHDYPHLCHLLGKTYDVLSNLKMDIRSDATQRLVVDMFAIFNVVPANASAIAAACNSKPRGHLGRPISWVIRMAADQALAEGAPHPLKRGGHYHTGS